MYPFIEDTVCLQKAETPELFYASAQAFGRFQRMLKDYPADTLFETIEKFHDTENRLANFEKALAADKLGRAKDARRRSSSSWPMRRTAAWRWTRCAPASCPCA